MEAHPSSRPVASPRARWARLCACSPSGRSRRIRSRCGPIHCPCHCCPDKDLLQNSVARQTLLFAQGGIECLDLRLIDSDDAFVCVDSARLFALQQPGSGDAPVIVVATGSTRADELLDFIGSVLGAEPEQCLIEGANLVLSSGAPARTIAEAGLGTTIKAGKLKRAAILSAVRLCIA